MAITTAFQYSHLILTIINYLSLSIYIYVYLIFNSTLHYKQYFYHLIYYLKIIIRDVRIDKLLLKRSIKVLPMLLVDKRLLLLGGHDLPQHKDLVVQSLLRLVVREY